MGTTFITMKGAELEAYGIINKLIEKQINGTIAAKLLCLSVRQTKRLKARVSKEGAQGTSAAIAEKNRIGKSSLQFSKRRRGFLKRRTPTSVLHSRRKNWKKFTKSK